MNFVADVVEAAPPAATALVERTAAGERRVHTFADLSRASAALAATLTGLGAARGSVVMVVAGPGALWVQTMLAALRAGLVVLACPEQLRPADLAARAALAAPAVVVAHPRHRGTLQAAALAAPVLLGTSFDRLELADPGGAGVGRGPGGCAGPGGSAGHPGAPVELAADDPCLLTFTSGTSGPAKAAVHAQRYLTGQRLQASAWLGSRPGDLVWCTAAPGWSKSARNGFVAAWLTGAAALVHDARFDAGDRVALAREEGVNVWCMAPTEYRMIAHRGALDELGRGGPGALRSLVAAGEALDVATLEAWREATGLQVRDGYGQTETGQLTGNPPGQPVRPGSMGRPLPGVRLDLDPGGDPGGGAGGGAGVGAAASGELVCAPASVPTFFLGYLDPAPAPPGAAVAPRVRPVGPGPWRTGDRVHRDDDGYLYFDSRIDDVIISAGYRIGPTEVEDVLRAHPAVADVAVVPAADPDRGAVVRAVVVLRAGAHPSAELAGELAAFARERTAPYKYPRRVDFATALPRTPSGKLRRAALRDQPGPADPPG